MKYRVTDESSQNLSSFESFDVASFSLDPLLVLKQLYNQLESGILEQTLLGECPGPTQFAPIFASGNCVLELADTFPNKYKSVSTFRRDCGFYKSVMVWYHFTSFVSSILSKGFTASRLIACTPQQEFVTVYRPCSNSTKIYISSSARTVSFRFVCIFF